MAKKPIRRPRRKIDPRRSVDPNTVARSKPFFDPLLVGTCNEWLNNCGLTRWQVFCIERLVLNRTFRALKSTMETKSEAAEARHRSRGASKGRDPETKVMTVHTRDHSRLPHFRARASTCWRTFDGVHWYRFDPADPEAHLPLGFNRHAVSGDLRDRGLLPR